MTSFQRLSALALLPAALLLGGCATKAPVSATYDFGPLPAPQAAATPATPATPAAALAAAPIPALVIADVNGPASLDSNRMYYRLLYADAQQARPYAHNSWSATPLQLLSQRLRARVAQAGVKVLVTTDAAIGMPLLRLEADDFSQNFDSQASSNGQVSLRASLFRNHKLVDQRTFTRSTPAPSADAAGGARALAASSDAIAADILAWLAALPPQQQSASQQSLQPSATRP
ncbi:ABC-type transport auxiliary lipoprotein family protein [Pseudoduganella namucuonensis]|uniref:Cholesterol transport system auxiliary component n=1 Tax=Pseudoduganella namucuonensis TaxID=1035707 RepID=A0A1I7M0U2_9BURK|nr:ABC-type transport auxiliary lipoprotein family protein [Pseudoduganella namucuonensis]SFV15546.1 cholesterol transport system auxiliary component [Pseudoduganella namucuonensis]